VGTRTDVVVTVPKARWNEWLAEGDLPGQAEWACFFCAASEFTPGARCYVVAHGRLRGFAPLVRIDHFDGGFAFIRRGGAEPCTIARPIPGFRGWRYRSWNRDEEIAFPDWMTAGVPGRHPDQAPRAVRQDPRKGSSS
jgi:hypothetical protein